MTLLPLALKSLWNRRATAALIVLSIAISVALLLGVRQMHEQARAAFGNTVSGTDLIVGARTGQINLLLYSVFHLGDATNNISWDTFEKLSGQRDVAWAIPLSLGDSHRGFRVLGTNEDYFRHYRFARDRALELQSGHSMRDLYDAVLGAQVARQLGYRIGDRIVLAHGTGAVSFAQHDDQPFVVAGILRPTGTPVDRTVHVSLEAIEAIHLDWHSGRQASPGARASAEDVRAADLTPQSITAMLIGLKSKLATFQLQRAINEYPGEPLLAILPGVALTQLWSVVGLVETALVVIGWVVVVAALLCLLTALLTGMNERRREMAILRSVGARPAQVFALFMSEATVLAIAGVAAGVAMTYAALFAARPILQNRFGLFLEPDILSRADLAVLGTIIGAAVLIGAVPAWQAYRRTLADGLTIRV